MELPEKKWFSINGAAKFLEISEEEVEYYLAAGKLIASIRLLHTNNYLHKFGEESMDDFEIDIDSDQTKYILEQYNHYMEYIDATGDRETEFNEFIDIPELDKTAEYYLETDEGYINLYSGIFNINRYDYLEWDNEKCDLEKSKIRLTRVDNNNVGQFYVFFASKIISKNQIMLSQEILVQFRDSYQKNKSQSETVALSQTKRPWEDEDSGFFSEELATAVQIWERVFGHKPDKPKTRSFKADIELILDARRDLNEAAKKRLGIVLNPEKFKLGGRPNKSS